MLRPIVVPFSAALATALALCIVALGATAPPAHAAHNLHSLRHTFGTAMAAAGVPMRTLQEWMGHRDFKTTLIYADYAPSEHERLFIDRAFGRAGALDAPPTASGAARQLTS